MITVQAVYDGNVFVPETSCAINKGSKVSLVVNPLSTDFSDKQKKLAAFRNLTEEVNNLNKTDPLPAEFDEILSKKVNFRELVDL